MEKSNHDQADATRSERTTPLGPGTPAPDFDLPTAPGKTLHSVDFRGRPLIMVFYPADWSPVCGDELSLYNQVLPEFQKYGAELVGVSVDGPWCHAEFSRQRNLHFPLLSDFEPKGEMSRAYGAYRFEDGTSQRALFVIDDDGVIRWSYVSPVDVNPGVNGILDALDALTPRKESRQSPQERKPESRP